MLYKKPRIFIFLSCVFFATSLLTHILSSVFLFRFSLEWSVLCLFLPYLSEIISFFVWLQAPVINFFSIFLIFHLIAFPFYYWRIYKPFIHWANASDNYNIYYLHHNTTIFSFYEFIFQYTFDQSALFLFVCGGILFLIILFLPSPQ